MTAEAYPYASRLMTPRKDIAERDPNIVPGPLLESQHLLACGADYKGSSREYSDAIEAGRSASRVVRNTLWFESASVSGRTLSPDALALNQATNCHGYTIVTSECLDFIGVPHHIAYMNGHSVVVLLDDDPAARNKSRMFTLGGADKKFYFGSELVLSGKPPLDQLEKSEFAHNMLDTRDYAAQGGMILDDEVAEHPWLSYHGEGATRFAETESQARMLERIRVRMYPGELGRKVLESYVLLNSVVSQKNVPAEQAEHGAQLMMQLQGLYPEMDPRSKYAAPVALRRHLIRHKLYDAAIASAGAFDLSVRGESNASFFLPDTVFQAGCDSNSVDMLILARGLYETAPSGPWRQMKRGKLGKNQRAINRLNDADTATG